LVAAVLIILVGAVAAAYALGGSKNTTSKTINPLITAQEGTAVTGQSSSTISFPITTSSIYTTTSFSGQTASTGLAQVSSSLQTSAISAIASLTTTSTYKAENVNMTSLGPTAPILSQNAEFEYYLDNSSLSAPTGIVSYGLSNQSGSLEGYSISTSEVVAKAEIYSLGAFNATLPNSLPFNVTFGNAEYGANLQLNVMVLVNTTAGRQIYWVQNTNRFDTLDKYVNSPRDLVFNVTDPNGDPISVESGNGSVSGKGNNEEYSYGVKFFPYSLPLALDTTISVRVISGAGVQILFSNQPFGNGLFDQVVIPIPNVISAAITVTPYQTDGFLLLDSELVWTGFCCGYENNFTAMNSTLSLYFMNEYGSLQLYPSFYSFGSDTAETATSLKVVPTSTGADVSTGPNDNEYLSNPN